MGDNSKIEWTDATFNPWIGCTKVGPGCDHCYAEALMDTRHHRAEWGAGKPRVRSSADYWHQPVAWNAKPFYQCLDCGARFAPPRRKEGYVTCPGCGPCGGKYGDEGEAARVAPARRRVFCASLADVFDNEVDPAWRHDLFNLTRDTPNLDWLLLTKRPQNIVRMVRDHGCIAGNGTTYLPRNVWLGTTTEDQKHAEQNIPAIVHAKQALGAAVAFISAEPLLSDLDVEYPAALFPEGPRSCCDGRECGCMGRPIDPPLVYGVDWVIVGGESGHGARDTVIGHIRQLVRQCAASGVPVLVKQLGAKPVNREGVPHPLKDKKGGDWSEWPEDLRVRQFPEPRP